MLIIVTLAPLAGLPKLRHLVVGGALWHECVVARPFCSLLSEGSRRRRGRCMLVGLPEPGRLGTECCRPLPVYPLPGSLPELGHLPRPWAPLLNPSGVFGRSPVLKPNGGGLPLSWMQMAVPPFCLGCSCLSPSQCPPSCPTSLSGPRWTLRMRWRRPTCPPSMPSPTSPPWKYPWAGARARAEVRQACGVSWQAGMLAVNMEGACWPSAWKRGVRSWSGA